MGTRYLRNNKTTERVFHEVMGVREFLDVIETHGDKTVFMWSEHKEDKSISYEVLCEWVRNISAGLDEMGLAGKTVGIMGDTSPYWIAAYLSILATGGRAVPLDRELAASEVNGFLDIVDAQAVFFSSSLKDKYVDMAAYNANRTYISMGDDIEDCISFMEVMETGRKNEQYAYPEQRDVEEVCEYLFTSGTTGTSKCVMLCEKNVFSVVNSACAVTDFSGDDVMVSVLPVHHTYELAILMCELVYGMKIGINDSLRNVISNFKKYKPTGLTLVPLFVNTVYKRIWSEAKRTGQDKKLKAAIAVSDKILRVGVDVRRKIFKSVLDSFGGNLNKIVCGGAALNPDMVYGFESLGISIYEGYGITECSPLVCVTPYNKRKIGSVGPAVPCCEIRIDGDTISENGYITGEIQVKGDNVMLGYFNNDEANAEVFTEDGWFRTGDVGYMDEDGYLFITGRCKSVIVLENGKNVFPEEIEEYLENVPGVSECVVVGRPDTDGETILLTAVIYPDVSYYEGKSVSDMKKELAGHINQINKKLPSFKHIRKVDLVDKEFEKTTSRKIKRHLVK
ncbi:MAG: AMP-binding protein [Clostridia bacterium]|nr:AMP-binding protein [Clostridia bacterium]